MKFYGVSGQEGSSVYAGPQMYLDECPKRHHCPSPIYIPRRISTESAPFQAAHTNGQWEGDPGQLSGDSLRIGQNVIRYRLFFMNPGLLNRLNAISDLENM